MRRRAAGESPVTSLIVPLGGDWDDQTQYALDLLKTIPPTTQHFRGESDHVHVSDALGKCLRKIALTRRLKARYPAEKVIDGHGLTYAMGDAVHDYIKARFIKGHPDKVWALWSCKCGETSIGPCTFAKRGKHTKCECCGTDIDQHNEVPLYDEEHDLVGRPDLVLWLESHQAFYIIEIKSMNGDEWKELARPIPDHVMQISFYWHLFHVNKMPVIDSTSVLYASKTYTFKSPYKEMPIPQPATQKRLEPYFAELKVLKAAKEGGPLPPRTMCGTLDAPEAKKCHVCVACFQQ